MNNLSNLAWINGRFISQSEATITLHDAGFVMGATVTDMSRSFGHKPFMLIEHIQRFLLNCESCFIPITVTALELQKIAEELISRNCTLLKPEEDLALVLFATPGPIGFYLGEPGGAGDGLATLGMHTFKLPFHRYRPWLENGAELLTSSILQPSLRCLDPTIKQRSRMHWWIAERDVKKRSKTASAILLDENGYLTETASANLLIIRNAGWHKFKISVPKREKVLDGVALRVVREFARDSEIEWNESDILPSDLTPSDAGLITSSTFCFAPVKSINDTKLSIFPTFNGMLLDYWQKKTGINFHTQILKNL